MTRAPEPPKIDVFFNLGPQVGTIATRVHHVNVTPDALVLYYDTRYDVGTQYQPADREEPLIVEIPSQKATYTVVSKRLRDSFGCIDWLMLLLVKADVAPGE